MGGQRIHRQMYSLSPVRWYLVQPWDLAAKKTITKCDPFTLDFRLISHNFKKPFLHCL